MKRKLGIIISLSVVAVLIITVICLAVINKNYAPEISTKPYQVVITNSTGSGSYSGGTAYEGLQKENFEKFVNLYNKSFNQSILASVFNGHLNNAVDVEYEGTSIPSSTGYKVVLTLPGTILMENGSAYKVNSGDDAMHFEELTFYVVDGTGFASFSMFAKIRVDESRVNYYEIKTIANTKALFDFVSELNFQ